LLVKASFDAKTRASSRICDCDEVNNGLEATKWFASPVPDDVTEESMFNLVPFACTWRKMADTNCETRIVGELL